MNSCNGADRFDDLLFGEKDTFSFKFADILRPGETISNPTILVTVIDGDDSSPQAIVDGTPGVDATNTIASVNIDGLVADVCYCLSMSADTSSGLNLTIPGQLCVKSPCAS